MLLPSFNLYSRYVNLMKIVLPIGIFLAFGLVFLWPYFHSTKDMEKEISINLSEPEIKENRMIKPHYLSTDKKGQPFQVDAEWAKQESEDVANLSKPEGSIALEGQIFNLNAQRGTYNSKTKTLNLEGKVTLISTDGYNVETEKAHINVDGKTIEGNVLVEGEGPTGKIRGEGFKVESGPKGKILTLKGRSQIVIYPSALKKKQGSHDS